MTSLTPDHEGRERDPSLGTGDAKPAGKGRGGQPAPSQDRSQGATMTRSITTMLAALVVSVGFAAAAADVEVAKTAGCGCCEAWADHLRADGFNVALRDTDALARLHRLAGVPQGLEGCHIAKVDGYVVSGHVPAADVRRLLAERPDAVGLSVPGMPVGSPGMEMGESRDAFDVLLIRRDGRAEVFARYPAR